MAYSSLFSVIHDEQHPIGNIGRGSHYSVLSCVQWNDRFMQPQVTGNAEIQKLAVIWDEDHDERIIPILETAYTQCLIAPVKFVGERKGHLSVIVDSDFWKYCNNKREFTQAWEKLAGSVGDDWWSCEVQPESEAIESSIIHPGGDKMIVYLKNIDNLWSLGIAPYKAPYRAPVTPHAGELDPQI